MKICIITSFYPPFFFGGERAVQREVEALERRGHEITVITSSPDRKFYAEEINSVKIYRFFPYNLYPPYQFQSQSVLARRLSHIMDFWNIRSYRVVRRILVKEKSEVVYVHNFKGLSSSVFSASNSLGLPTVFSANDYSMLCPRSTLLRNSGEICLHPSLPCRIISLTQRLLFDRSKPSMVIANAQFTLDKYREAGFFSGLSLIREVIGTELNDNIVKKDYDTFNILYIGGVTNHKGVHILIDAFKKMRKENIKLHIVGKGKDLDEMKRLAGDDLRITFYGFMPDEELLKLRQIANVSVVPSIWYDMAQGVICESFSYGTPVIGSRIGGIPELIEEGYNGLLFEAGNSEELGAILERLANNTQELKQLEQGALESRGKYDIERHISRLENIFAGLVNEAR